MNKSKNEKARESLLTGGERVAKGRQRKRNKYSLLEALINYVN